LTAGAVSLKLSAPFYLGANTPGYLGPEGEGGFKTGRTGRCPGFQRLSIDPAYPPSHPGDGQLPCRGPAANAHQGDIEQGGRVFVR
jgi:hypothetical protein